MDVDNTWLIRDDFGRSRRLAIGSVNILLVRLRLIGDVVFTTPIIRALRRRYPDARLAYVVEPHASPVVSGNPHLDEVIVASRPDARGRLGADLRLARTLRAARYDLVLDLHGGPRSALLTWATGARRRIGYTVPGRGWMYTERVQRDRLLRPRHSVVNQWDLLRPLGFEDPDPERDATEMPATAGAAGAVADKLASAGVDAGRDRVIALHVSAGNPFRRWPAASFVALIAALLRADSSRRIVVVSGPSEHDAARRIGEQARARLGGGVPGVVDALDFDLPELRALMDRAALFVGGDSGPLHVAGTSGVPIVGLYGPTLAARSAPWRSARFVTESVEADGLACRPCDQRRCETGDFRCLGSITPAQVADAAERALARGR
jgi:lipopolysaccharide heptosyltransferase II